MTGVLRSVPMSAWISREKYDEVFAETCGCVDVAHAIRVRQENAPKHARSASHTSRAAASSKMRTASSTSIKGNGGLTAMWILGWDIRR